MKNIDVAFRNHTHISKVRIAKFVNYNIHSSNSEITAHNGMMNTILGLLAKGEINCAGENIMEQQDIFAAPSKAPENDPDSEYKPRPAEQPTTGFGKVKTAEEKAREAAEEEERRRAEEEQKRKEEEEEREAKAKKGPSFTSKLMKWIGSFTEPDE